MRSVIFPGSLSTLFGQSCFNNADALMYNKCPVVRAVLNGCVVWLGDFLSVTPQRMMLRADGSSVGVYEVKSKLRWQVVVA